MKIMIPKDFNWQFYLNVNPDLIDAGLKTKQQAEAHWLGHGHKEKRMYKPVDPKDISHTKIVNAYHDQSTSGIGDFLRGCIFLRQLNKEHFNISYSCHAISKYISSQYAETINPDHIIDIYHQTVATYGIDYSLNDLQQTFYDVINNNDYAIVSSMYSDLLYPKNNEPISKNFANHSLDISDRVFMQNNLKFNDMINHAANLLNIQDYGVYHVRLGDYATLQNKMNINSNEIINQLNYKNYSIDQEQLAYTIFTDFCKHRKKSIIMSDSNEFKKLITKLAKKLSLDIETIHTNSNHCSSQPGLLGAHNYFNHMSEDELFFLVLDMKIMSKANFIRSYSVYPWGSGFSYSIAKIYNIPLEINIL